MFQHFGFLSLILAVEFQPFIVFLSRLRYNSSLVCWSCNSSNSCFFRVVFMLFWIPKMEGRDPVHVELIPILRSFSWNEMPVADPIAFENIINKSSLLIAEIHILLHSEVSSSVYSPRLTITSNPVPRWSGSMIDRTSLMCSKRSRAYYWLEDNGHFSS